MKQLAGKILLIGMVVLLGAFSETEQGELNWNLDVEVAKSIAVESDRIIVMSFQGSDWCGNCKRLEKALFQDPTFVEFANKNVVMLKVDFPMKKANKLSKEQTAHNEALAEEFNSEGVFPKVIILNAAGEKLGDMAYPSQTSEEYIASIKSFIK